MATIQGIYVALFGRPADPAGLAYWNSVTNNGQDLSKLIGGLTNSKEYTDRFVGQSQSDIITSIYQTTFGHAPDPAGLSFFLNGLQAGTFKIESLAISILDGAQGSDRTVVSNKVAAADLFTTSLDTPAEIAAFNGKSAADIGVLFLSKVTSDPATIPTVADVNTTIRSVQTNAGQAPAGGDGSTQPDGPTTLPNTYKVNDSVTPHKADGYLLTGTGNPNTGFAVTTNPNEGIELGLSVRERHGNVLPGTEVAGHVVNFTNLNPLHGDGYAMAYSVSSEDALSGSVFKLLVDTDPTATAKYATFILEKDSGTVSGYKWTLDTNNSGSIETGETLSITDDDGKDGTSVQNIQPFSFLFANKTLPQDVPVGDFDVKLQALKQGTVVAESGVHIQTAGVVGSNPDKQVATFDGTQLYVGTGNSAEHFATATSETAHVQLGISGRYAYGDVVKGNVEADENGLDVVHFSMTAGSDVRFAYSISSLDNDKLSDYNFRLNIDVDSSAGQKWVQLDLVANTVAGEHVNQSNSKYDWVGTYQDANGASHEIRIADDGGDAGGKTTQNIQNISWYDGDNSAALAAGEYDVQIEAVSKDGILVGVNHVVFDIVAA